MKNYFRMNKSVVALLWLLARVLRRLLKVTLVLTVLSVVILVLFVNFYSYSRYVGLLVTKAPSASYQTRTARCNMIQIYAPKIARREEGLIKSVSK